MLMEFNGNKFIHENIIHEIRAQNVKFVKEKSLLFVLRPRLVNFKKPSYPVSNLLLEERFEHGPHSLKQRPGVVEIETLPPCRPGALLKIQAIHFLHCLPSSS